MSLVYLHRRKDNPDYVFYVGIGAKTRPISQKDRNDEWHKEVKEHGFLIEIVADNLKAEETYELEVKLIAKYGRKDLGLGTLVNETNGGKGKNGHIMTEKQRENMRQRMLKNNPFKGKKHSEETKKYLSKITKGRHAWNKGVKSNLRNAQSKLSDEEVREIRKLWNGGTNQYNSNTKELAIKYGVSPLSIRNCGRFISYNNVK
jgi:hypothetical protein